MIVRDCDVSLFVLDEVSPRTFYPLTSAIYYPFPPLLSQDAVPRGSMSRLFFFLWGRFRVEIWAFFFLAGFFFFGARVLRAGG